MGNISVRTLSYSLLKTEDVAIELEELKVAPQHDDPSPRALSSVISVLINSGDSIKALQILEQFTPDLAFPGSEVYLILSSQAFIDLIRENSVIEALELAQKLLSQYKESTIKVWNYINQEFCEIKINEIMGLLCYVSPIESVLGYLLNEKQREKVAEIVNLRLNPEDEKKSYFCNAGKIWKCLKKKSK
ncbi:unnamed protein product [Blepharisma stoltei]|uniref:CTLH domain-containing protein n=1 Tax=Blepharisma stoltei TaxID=1481888 RepID=A0AAU9IJ68_9CILI|nr:unnamed protein product [Blepharisma stoltei]